MLKNGLPRADDARQRGFRQNGSRTKAIRSVDAVTEMACDAVDRYGLAS